MESLYGNPTKSVAVNEVTKIVLKHEVRREGAPSQVKRDLKKAEHIATINKFQSMDLDYYRIQVPTMMKLHFNSCNVLLFS